MSKKKSSIQESYKEIKNKAEKLEATFENLASELRNSDIYDKITFNEFLFSASQSPLSVFRDIFVYFFDMINYYVPKGTDDYDVTDDSIGFLDYNFEKLFVSECDDPFFADRLFSNRFMNLVTSLKNGIQNNQILLFEGPPGSGKSTFLNNLLNKMELYSKTPEGVMYKSHWRLDVKMIMGNDVFDKVIESSLHTHNGGTHLRSFKSHIEISCPSNDNPILNIPVKYRKKFLNELITDKKTKKILFESKAYSWVLKDKPCSICSSIFNALLDKLRDPFAVLGMLYAKKVRFDRQFGKGISVFNPGDEHIKKAINDSVLQNIINGLFINDEVRYIYSNLAYTNNGIYALMDIKDKNIDRLIDLHGIISDGVHKIEHVEERIKSLFMGLVNPEDKKHYENVKSFQDRIIHVSIPYILDYDSEVQVYKNKFGHSIDKFFLPGVLENFAKIIVASRMNITSDTLKRWIGKPEKYNNYCDKNLLLLKMELYKGNVPDWIDETDKKGFVKTIRKDLLLESDKEGGKGISGRQSLAVFGELLSRFKGLDNLITLDDIKSYFIQNEKLNGLIPENFLNAVEVLYEYQVLQQIKEALYYYSEKQIQREILDYLFAINFDMGANEVNPYTGKILKIQDTLFDNFENIILGAKVDKKQKMDFRKDMQKEYITYTLSREIKLEGKDIVGTRQYYELFDKYIYVVKKNVLQPYIENTSFRTAVLDYSTAAFKSHSNKLKQDVTRLISNLKNKYNYTEKGAQQVTVYILDKKINEKYGVG